MDIFDFDQLYKYYKEDRSTDYYLERELKCNEYIICPLSNRSSSTTHFPKKSTFFSRFKVFHKNIPNDILHTFNLILIKIHDNKKIYKIIMENDNFSSILDDIDAINVNSEGSLQNFLDKYDCEPLESNIFTNKKDPIFTSNISPKVREVLAMPSELLTKPAQSF
jgi:hypothetical protein